MSTYAFLKTIHKKNYKIIVLWLEHFETFNQSTKNDKYLLINIFISKIVIIIAETYEKFFSKLRKKSIFRKKLRARLLEKLKNKVECFDVKKTNKLSRRRDQNYKINLIFETKFLFQKVYNLIKNQVIVIKIYVNKMLTKNFIRSNLSYYAISVLIIKKFKKDFKMCVNYRAFNVLIIKNRNCLSFIRKILVRLYAIKYYIKLDVIAIFNKIRIRENDKKKTTFLIKYELYKYVVMLFDLCNALKTFQFYINEILRNYLNDFCIIYLNDVLIYSNNKKKHTIYVRKIFNKLYVVDLYLNINKYEFYVNKVKYFKFIIIIKDIKINSKKIDAILNWKTF